MRTTTNQQRKKSFLLKLFSLACLVVLQSTVFGQGGTLKLYVRSTVATHNNLILDKRDETLKAAIDRANLNGLFQKIEILFDASGLVEIDQLLPELTALNVTIKPLSDNPVHPGVEQGIVYTGGRTSAERQIRGIKVKNAKKVHIENLIFKGFRNNTVIGGGTSTTVFKNAINILDCRNIQILNCQFYDNYESIQLNKSLFAKIHDCVFMIETTDAIDGVFIRDIGNYSSSSIAVSKALFNGKTNLPTANSQSMTAIKYENWSGMPNLFATDNTIEYCGIGVEVYSKASSRSGRIYLEHNKIKNTNVGIKLINPFPDWVANHNRFDACGTDFHLLFTEANSNSNNGFRLVKQALATYTVYNADNHFTDEDRGNRIQVEVSGSRNSYPKVDIVGLDLMGGIYVKDNIRTDIRYNKLRGQPDRPIHISPISINPQVSFDNAKLENSKLLTDVTLSNYTAANGNFLFDYYLSNSDGDLLDHLETETNNTGGATTYKHILTLPSSTYVTYGSRLAVTVTSTDDQGQEMGTSKAAYIQLENPRENCDCISTYSPIPEKEYVLSAWVKEDNARTKTTYTAPAIVLEYDGQAMANPTAFYASGKIIEGWQKVEEVFTIPKGTKQVTLKLQNESTTGADVFFDDIRLFPMKGNMKSFVYDPETMRLTAELDENNYATYYTYDSEGNLVKVRKETIDGIKTITEGRTHTVVTHP